MDDLWEDPDFGFRDPNNFIRWDPLTYGRDPILYQQLVNEMKQKFGLPQEMIDQARHNWNNYLVVALGFISNSVPIVKCSD
jgi:hypothetical protein